MSHVIVVGGGIAGLSVAHRLMRDAGDRRINVTVLEGSDRAGGTIHSKQVGGYLCEHGPQGLLDSAPDTLTLVQELGLEPIASAPASRRRFLFRGGRLREVPSSPLSAVTSDVLSWRGKLRLAAEPFIRRCSSDDETIDSFAARRLGHEVAKMLVDPMVSGVYAGDAAQLSVRSAFPALWQLERDHGSLVRGMLARRGRPTNGSSDSVPRLGRLISFAHGIEALPRALAGSLGTRIRCGSRVTGLQRLVRGLNSWSGWRVLLASGDVLEGDHVVLTGHPSIACCVIKTLDPMLAALLSDIPSAPVAVVALGYRRDAISHSLQGFGFLVPRSEGRRTIGVLWESSIFPGRAPVDHVLLRAMIGGAHDPGAVALSDDQLLAIATADVQRALGATTQPEFTYIVRHRGGIPQCTLGHFSRMARLEETLERWPGLHLTGWGYRGVSINHCIADAVRVAAEILAARPAGPE